VQTQMKSSALILALVTALGACSSNKQSNNGPEMPAGPGEIPTKFVPGDCNLDKPAFCETFEKEFPGGKGGVMDETAWSISRWGLPMTGGFRNFARRAATSTDDGMNTPSFCGGAFDGVVLPDDLRLCDGTDGGGFASKQLNEVFNDDDSFAFTSTRIRQPFDFKDRAGTVVFDVDAKRNIEFDGHGWWIEFWMSADPTPMPYHGAPTVGSYARRAVGFQLAPANPDCFHQETPVCNQVGRIVVEKDFKIEKDGPIDDPNAGFNTLDGKLNRFKFVVTQDSIEAWGSNYDGDGKMVKLAVASNLGLDWSRGYIHFQHAQYNAGKAHATSSQTYRWDNIAFDGPAFPTPRAYEAPDRHEEVGQAGIKVVQFGYDLVRGGAQPLDLTIPGVDLTNALNATLNFNFVTHGSRDLHYSFNGGAMHTLTTPESLGHDDLMRTFSLPVDLTELIDGDNVVHFECDDPGTGNNESLGNIDITVDVSE
jgi:hypothetical protein